MFHITGFHIPGLCLSQKAAQNVAMAAILNAITTAVPEFSITQSDVWARMASLVPGGIPARLSTVYENAGIEKRHIVQTADAYMGGQDWTTRNQIYLQESEKLLTKVTADALDKADMEAAEINTIICVSTTGIATPSVPSQMIASSGFREDVMIVPLFGYGCAGGVMGLQVARDMVLADPSRKILLLTVELCSLAFRIGDLTKKGIVSTALFADGASGCVLSGSGDGPALGAFTQVTWPGTRDMMGWDIDEQGLGLVLGRDIPNFVRKEFSPVIDTFLSDNGLTRNALTEPACHPGGRKVIEALETYFDHLPGGLPATRDILAQYGNMSAPTVHFVMQELLQQGGNGPLLLTALGPGFTGALGLLER